MPFFRHDLGDAEVAAVAEVLAGSILTTGEFVERFETRFGELLGRRYAVGVTSCTGAIHLALAGLGVGPGDEVITTPMTFIATATAILQAGATPRFVDVEADTGNLDATLVEAAITPRTRAIVPVHLYGLMCDMRALRAIADRHGLLLVEDAAHCVEGERDGVRPGQLSNAACFSFYATKAITSGEGGAVVTDDPELAKRLRLLRLHGMTKNAYDRDREGYRDWDMVTFGWKYNMDNIQAALLLPQLDRLRPNLERRRRLAERYTRMLANVPGLRLPATRPDAIHARHLFPVLIAGAGRSRALDGLQREGIGVTVNYRAVHLLEYFASMFGLRSGSFPVAERFGEETLSLPFYPRMPEEHVDIVADALRRVLDGP